MVVSVTCIGGSECYLYTVVLFKLPVYSGSMLPVYSDSECYLYTVVVCDSYLYTEVVRQLPVYCDTVTCIQ